MMKAARAIEVLKSNYPDQCFSMLREAVDQALVALDLQIPKEPNEEGECPVCKTSLEAADQIHCEYCGQKLDHPKKVDPEEDDDQEVGIIMMDGKPIGLAVRTKIKFDHKKEAAGSGKIDSDLEAFKKLLKGLMEDEN